MAVSGCTAADQEKISADFTIIHVEGTGHRQTLTPCILISGGLVWKSVLPHLTKLNFKQDSVDQESYS